MKVDIHPQYFPTAKITCSCGNVITVGSTKETLKTELCSKCHPFYTGQQKLVDTAGRVDKFEARRKKAVTLKEMETKRKTEKKKKEVYVEKVVPQEVIERAMSSAEMPTGKWGKPLGDSLSEEVQKEQAVAAETAPVKKSAKKVIKKGAAKKSASKKK